MKKFTFRMLSIWAVFVVANISLAQPARVIGAGGFQFDNRSVPVKTILLVAPTSLTNSYQLQLPNVPPPGTSNTLVSDETGQLFWSSGTSTLPPLAPGNIWVGNASSIATPYAPTAPGSLLILSNTNTPVWSTAIPANTTISASQITSGTIQPGVTINVGNGGSIQSTGGNITANNLNGAGVGKYSGTIHITLDAPSITINYAGIQAGATVLLSIQDPGIPGVIPFLNNITPGAGFTVTFSALYPTNTGSLAYTVINP